MQSYGLFLWSRIKDYSKMLRYKTWETFLHKLRLYKKINVTYINYIWKWSSGNNQKSNLWV
jgi:hypothetical protein